MLPDSVLLEQPRLDDPLPWHVFLEASEFLSSGTLEMVYGSIYFDSLIAAIVIRNAVPAGTEIAISPQHPAIPHSVSSRR